MTENSVPLLGQESIPSEFPRVAVLTDLLTQADVGIYKCSICRALVVFDDAQAHADWHNGEFRRNFSGF